MSRGLPSLATGVEAQQEQGANQASQASAPELAEARRGRERERWLPWPYPTQTVHHLPKAGDRSNRWFVYWFPKTQTGVQRPGDSTSDLHMHAHEGGEVGSGVKWTPCGQTGTGVTLPLAPHSRVALILMKLASYIKLGFNCAAIICHVPLSSIL